jgi:hypothetical protein
MRIRLAHANLHAYTHRTCTHTLRSRLRAHLRAHANADARTLTRAWASGEAPAGEAVVVQPRKMEARGRIAALCSARVPAAFACRRGERPGWVRRGGYQPIALRMHAAPPRPATNDCARRPIALASACGPSDARSRHACAARCRCWRCSNSPSARQRAARADGSTCSACLPNSPRRWRAGYI